MVLCYFLVISGPNEQGVMSAKTRIELIVDTARTKTKPTHFISIPLACESTVARFNEFKEIVLEQCSQVCNKLILLKHHRSMRDSVSMADHISRKT